MALAAHLQTVQRHEPLAPAVVLVGSSQVATVLPRRLALMGGGLANVRFVSIYTFALEMAVAAGLRRERVLAEGALLRLVGRALRESGAAAHGYFAPVAHMPGLDRAFLKSITDLREAGITASGAPWGSPGSRAASVQQVLALYETTLAREKCSDRAGVYHAAAQGLCGRAWHQSDGGVEGAIGPSVGDASSASDSPAPVLSGGGTLPVPGGGTLPVPGNGTLPVVGNGTLPVVGNGTLPVPRAEESPGAWSAGAVMLYGLYDLPQCQRLFIEALVAGRPAAVFFPRPARGEAYVEPGLQFFSHLAFQLEELDAAPGQRRGAGPHAPAGGTQTTAAAYPLPAELVSVRSDEGEITETAALLSAAAERHGLRFHEAAVIAPSAQRADEVAVGLQARGVPIARRLPLAGRGVRRLVTFLDCAWPSTGRPLGRAAVIEHASTLALSSDMSSAADVSLWNDESRRCGVVDGQDWAPRLEARRRYLAARLASAEQAADGRPASDPDEIGGLRRRLEGVRSLGRLVESLRARAEQVPTRAPWSTMLDSLRRLAQEQCAVRDDDPVLTALDSLRTCGYVEAEVSVGEAAAVARDVLTALRESHGSIGRRGVAVMTPYEARGLRFRLVVFGGLATGGFPSGVPLDPILPDGERRVLAKRLGASFTEAAAREQEADLLFALARESAQWRFVALSPRVDAAGGTRQPSRTAVELAEEIVEGPVTAETITTAPLSGGRLRRAPSGMQPARVSGDRVWLPGERAPVDERELDVALLLALRGGARCPTGGPRVPASCRTYLETVCGHDAARRLLGRRMAASVPSSTAWDGVFKSRRARDHVAGSSLFAAPQAPTALQDYVRCPFAFYLRHVLRLEPSDMPEAVVEAEPVDVGTVAHRVLRRVFSAVATGLSQRQAVGMVADLVAEECQAAVSRGAVGVPLSWAVVRERLTADLQGAVDTDPCWAQPQGPQPWGCEVAFGRGQERVTLQVSADRSIAFYGRIDRIDRAADGSHLRVVDYKTGRGRVEQDLVKAGRDIQLPTYLLAARHVVPGAASAEVRCLFRMVTRRRERDDVPLPSDEGAVIEQLRHTTASVVSLAERGVFPRVAPAEVCRYCDLAHGCDELEVTRERKRMHPSLAEVLELQGECGVVGRVDD